MQQHKSKREFFNDLWGKDHKVMADLLTEGINKIIRANDKKLYKIFSQQREQERKRIYRLFQEILSKTKILSGTLQICSGCKRIRDTKGRWVQIEQYIHKNSEADFSHGLCRDCAKVLYPEIDI